MSGQRRTPVLIAVALIAAIVAAIIIGRLVPSFEPLSFIGVAGTLALAFLTVAYVMVTSGQLSVMRDQLTVTHEQLSVTQGQLAEMRRTRELESQPLPYVTIKSAYLERPAVFFSPPSITYVAGARLVVEFVVTNEGSQPAINIVADAHVHSDGQDEVMELGPRAFGVLAPGAQYPADEAKAADMSTGVRHSSELIATLRDRSYRQPALLCCRVLYKNLLGGGFTGEWRFILTPDTEDDFPTLANWESKLVAFDVEYKEHLSGLRSLKEKDADRWRTQFDALRDAFRESLAGGDRLSLNCRLLPNGYRARALGRDAFEAAMKKVSFGHPLPNWPIAACPADKADAPMADSGPDAG